MNRARRRADLTALLVFALLSVLAWRERDRLFALFEPSTAGTASEVAPAEDHDAPPTSSALSPSPGGLSAGGGDSPPIPADAPPAGDAAPASGVDATPSPAVAAEPSGPRTPPGATAPDELAGSAEEQPAPAAPEMAPATDARDDVVLGRTETGLRTYALPELLAPTAAPDPIALALQSAAAAGPDDGEAIASAVQTLVELGREDDALEAYVVALESGLDDEGPRAALDPFATRKSSLLTAGARRLADIAELASERDLWLTARQCLDQARRLLDGARLEGGPPDAGLAKRLEDGRNALFRRRDAVAAMARAGVPLPEELVVGSRLRADADARRDQGALRDDRLHEEPTRHGLIVTELPLATARLAGRVVDAAHERACERFGVMASSFDRLRVELLDDEPTLESRRLRETARPPSSATAWLTSDRDGLVALDPRSRGDGLQRLWTDLSREATRRVLQRATGQGVPPPPWLAVGLAVQAEALRVADDDVLPLITPTHRLRQVTASQAGRGLPALALEDIIAMDGRDPDESSWAWALVAWLDEGAPGLPGRNATPQPLDALVSAWREGTSAQPLSLFRLTVLPRADGRALSMRDAHGAFTRWIEAHDALLRGDSERVRQEVARVRQALTDRRPDVAVDRLTLLLDARPADPDVLAATIDAARAVHHDDAALVYAAGLAGARALPTGSPPAEERYGEALAVSAVVGRALVAHDQALRLEAGALIENLLADGFPLAAVRLLDRLAAAMPVDGQWRILRERVLEDVLRRDDVVTVRHLDLDPKAPGRRGDLAAWRLEDKGLVTDSRHGVQAVTLRGLGVVRAKERVIVEIEFAPEASGQRHADDGRVFVGLLFGADSPVEQGTWGVFVTPSGDVTLARRGGLEWPSRPVGRAPRKATRLQVETRGDRLLLRTGERHLGELDLGSRSAQGWLAIYARRADVRLSGLRVERSRATDPRVMWFTRGLL